jgi:hypothetical protein
MESEIGSLGKENRLISTGKTLTRKMNLSILRHSGDRTRNQFLAQHVSKEETEISISLQTAIYNQVMRKSNKNFPLLSSPFRGHKDVDKKVEELLWMSKADQKKESRGRLTVAKPESVHLRDAGNRGRPLPLLLVSSHSLLRHRHILAHHTKPTKKTFHEFTQ